ncbi:MAG: circularly permuted type 2 ATP-grasp protein [Acidobacteria bacterium]|nr:circularly permuted type 2 ATP-grasp protein [Acidobacteriota bacterium]
MVSAPFGYAPLPGHYDEMVGPDGAVRPHWRALTDALGSFGRHELNRRAQEARRLIRDNGMTFHVHKGSGTQERPWPLDLIPFVIDGDEWARLERAVAQRARLFDSVLADLYGPQRLIHDRTLPAEWLHANPAFLRECHGVPPTGGRRLNVYAADLVRSPDGRWWVLGDRTEAPAGIGFALENRVVVNAVLSDLLLSSRVRRLAGTLENRKQALEASAPGHRENPRIVVMTPGPAEANYFEHAFLARHLGYTLVEGTDLTVRNDRVYIKTLAGLQPVDLVLRHQQSDACDPLEFGHSRTGVPGLVEAVRRGAVGVVNALGSGLVESPVLMAFLPVLCAHLLDEELQLPSVATWWCGDNAAREHVLGHLDDLVIKPAYPTGRRERTFGRRLPESQRDRLAARIARQPHRYVAQEQVALSTTPVRTAGGLAPRFFVMRVYAIARGDGYDVLPGGLGRVSSSTDSLDVTLLGGGSSKDVWVIGQTEEPHRSLLPQNVAPIDVSRATFDLPSRIADNLYWLGRYVERVEAAVRLLRAAVPLLSEESSRRSTAALSGALSFLVELEYVPAHIGAQTQPPERALESAVTAMLSESNERGSIGWQLGHVRSTAWLLRDRLSPDSWRIISRLESDLTAAGKRRSRSAVRRTLDQMVMILTSFGGAVSEGMTRGHGWRLLDVGRRIERALQVLQLLRHGLTGALEDERARIELLLDATGSVITYRSRYLTSLRVNLLVDLLLLDDANPRSVAFQLDQLTQHVKQLPETPAPGRRSPQARLLTDATAAIQLVDLDELCAVDDTGRRPGLIALLDRLQDDLGGLSDALTRDYLTHATPVRHLASR